MRSEHADKSALRRSGFFSRHASRHGLRFFQSSGSMPGVHSNRRRSSERLCSTSVLQQRPPPNQSVELTATRRTPIFSDD